jgi:hypothetical protein
MSSNKIVKIFTNNFIADTANLQPWQIVTFEKKKTHKKTTNKQKKTTNNLSVTGPKQQWKHHNIKERM